MRTFTLRRHTMKNLIVRTQTHHRRTLRLVAIVLFAALLSATPFHAAFAAQTAPALGSASGFAALAGSAGTCTNSTVTGDVGIVTGSLTNTGCTIIGTTDNSNAAAAAAYADFLTAYATLASMSCDQTLTGTLAGVTLSPGVYCFTAAATLTGTLTLDGPANGVWIFKIGTGGTGALTGTNFSVVMAGGAEGAPCPNVYWWVAQAATLTTSNFLGTILAGADITVTGGTFIGDALAGGAGTTSLPTGAVTLTGSTITACPPAGGNVKNKCNQGVGNGPEGCDPGNSNQGDPSRSNDELGGTPGNPGRKGGNGK
jgi:Ice-binding-like